MVLVNYTEFRTNLKKYLQLALTEKMILRNNGVVYEIIPSKEVRVNPSPSNDPYFDIPENIESMERGLAQSKNGEYEVCDDNALKALLNL